MIYSIFLERSLQTAGQGTDGSLSGCRDLRVELAAPSRG